MSNANDYCKLHYANEVIESTVHGISRGDEKSDYVHALLVRNPTHTFLFSLVLGPRTNGPGTYEFGKDDISAYFTVIDNKTGKVDKGGAITGGTLQLDQYGSGALVLRGSASNLSGVDQPPFKGATFGFNTDW